MLIMQQNLLNMPCGCLRSLPGHLSNILFDEEPVLICILTLQRKAGELEEPFRLSKDHEMFTRLSTILITGNYFALYLMS